MKWRHFLFCSKRPSLFPNVLPLASKHLWRKTGFFPSLVCFPSLPYNFFFFFLTKSDRMLACAQVAKLYSSQSSKNTRCITPPKKFASNNTSAGVCFEMVWYCNGRLMPLKIGLLSNEWIINNFTATDKDVNQHFDSLNTCMVLNEKALSFWHWQSRNCNCCQYPLRIFSGAKRQVETLGRFTSPLSPSPLLE